jgi:hypothetical protein
MLYVKQLQYLLYDMFWQIFVLDLGGIATISLQMASHLTRNGQFWQKYT